MTHLRHIRNRDKEQIVELGKILFREEDEIPLLQKALIQYVPSLSYVAVDGNNIIGFTLVCAIPTNVYYDFMDRIPHGYELAFLGISPHCQGRGLGTQQRNNVDIISYLSAFYMLVTGRCCECISY